MVRLHLLLTVLLSVPGLSAPEAPAKTATDLFEISFKPSALGSCAYVGEATMNGLVEDCLKLAHAGLLALDEHNSKPDAKRLLAAFFTSKGTELKAAEITGIRDGYEKVRNWLQQGGPTDDGKQPNKPHIYCYHNWLVKKTFQDLAFDAKGQIMKDANGRDMTIRAAYGSKGAGIIPYWSPDLKEYIWDEDYKESSVGVVIAGYCTNPKHQAATSHNIGASVITLCPSSFGTTQTALIPKLRAMRAVAPEPVENNDIKARNSGSRQPISDMFPTAATLFHELFHLILGNANTFIPATGQEEYQVSRMLRLNYANSVKNPETYTVVATAYDYTLNSVADPAGNRIEFASGYTTQG